MKVFVTGAGGYIGTTLVPLLLDEGHSVVALDRFFFGRQFLKDHPALEVHEGDIRDFEADLLSGVDAVIDLAAISNDPSGELNADWTWQINHAGRVRVARLAKEQGVKRYIFPSSCSIYGFREGVLNEESPINPLTTYAQANYRGEEDVLALNSEDFCVTVIRQATVYGSSGRMRFDLAINGMVKGFFQNRKIPILRDGTQWRPFVHVKDTSRAMMLLLQHPTESIAGQRFNVGGNDQNYKIFDLAKLVAESAGISFDYEWYGEPDHRSYQVDFSKVKKILGFEPIYSPREAVPEIWTALENGSLDPAAPTSITLKWYKKLIDEGVKIGLEQELGK